MFLDEARVAARISHPNVATVFELGKHDDTLLDRDGVPPRRAAARDHAPHRGARRADAARDRVPHHRRRRRRSPRGARAASARTARSSTSSTATSRRTTCSSRTTARRRSSTSASRSSARAWRRRAPARSKASSRTCRPSKSHGEQLDRRTDIFALGVVLWELTTGQRLFRMDSDLDTLAKVQECNVPRPCDAHPRVPARARERS